MTSFAALQKRVLDHIRDLVNNGTFTERGLARIARVSQPHIHNVLSGKRNLTAEVADDILGGLHVSLSELFQVPPMPPGNLGVSERLKQIGVLEGLIGPGHPWPSKISPHERLPMLESDAARMVHPVIARLGDDVRMRPLFCANDLVSIDQSLKLRGIIEPDGVYLIKRGTSGAIRRLRQTSVALYVITEDCLERSSAWEKIVLADIPAQHIVKAKIAFLAFDNQWLA